MNKTLLFIFFALAATTSPLFAAEEATPVILPDAMAQKISQDGKRVVAQSYYGSAIVYDITDGNVDYYVDYYPGNGNCISSDNTLVGQTMDGIAAIMKDGEAETPPSLMGSMSALNGITADGSRVCGWMFNFSGGVMQVPFYCDIDADGTVGSPQILPYPAKDFFNDIPQFCTAVWISDDGRRIIGQVMDATGFFSYPIVYTQDEAGEWSYSLPSAPLFNPDGIPFPEWPEFYEEAPAMTDFMTPEKAQEWEEDLEAYYASGDPDMNPWSIIDYYITDEQYEAFEKALADYNARLWDYYNKIDEYWAIMSEFSENANFALGVMAMNPEGTIMTGSMAANSDDENVSDRADAYITYIFNLTDDSFREVRSGYVDLIPTQVLSDGTVVALALNTYRSFLLLPDADEFISLEDYLRLSDSPALSWLEENLTSNIQVWDPETERYEMKETVITGLVSFSEDMSVFAGGLPGESMMTYIFRGMTWDAAVESLQPETPAGPIAIYNLQGVKVAETDNMASLPALPKGIYIINGKKIAL